MDSIQRYLEEVRCTLAALPQERIQDVVDILLSANHMSSTVFTLGNGGSAMWARLSVIPFVLLLLRYARDVDAGTAEAPEDLVWADRVLQGMAVIWGATFMLQVFA